MNKKKLALVLGAVPVAGGFHPMVAAQETDQPVFEEVIVTAQKREQSIYDVPVAISAFTAETVEKQGIQNLTDVGKFVPNLNVTEFSAGHTSSANPFIRGIGLQDHLITTDPGVSVYVDGVYLGRQVGQNWNLTNIERIEVLRGPQGTLYGRNSIGGAINIITRKPGDEEGGRVSVMAGTRDRLNVDAYANFRASETVALSVTGAYQSRDGLGDFVNITNPSKRVGEMEDTSGRLALLVEPTDSLSFLLAADINSGSGGLRPYDTLIDELPNGAVAQAGYTNADTASNPYNNNTGQEDQISVSNKAHGVSLTVEYAMSEAANLKLLASHRKSEYESGLDDDGFFDDFLSFPEEGEADQDSIELQLTGESGKFDYVFGLYHFEEHGENTQFPYTFNGFGGNLFFLEQDVTSKAVYANLGYAVTDQLRIAVGARYTEDEKDAFTIIVPDVIEVAGSRDWSETSWDVSAAYEMSDSMTVYGAVQSGYQSGQFPARPFCLFGDPGCFVAPDNITAQNYEIGLKGQPFDFLQMSIAVFYTEYKDLPYQVSTTSGGGFSTENIIVDQTSQGAEWEGTWLLGSNFRVHTTLGLIDVDVKDDNPAAVAPLTPEVTASVSPELTVPMGGGELTLRADWSHRDDMFGEPSSDPGRLTKIDSRELLNFDFTYRPDDNDWSLGVYGKNVTDERYDNARLNVSDYVLVIKSNDASEFGLRFTKEF
jgi:iron complex outermembrane recepter protein